MKLQVTLKEDTLLYNYFAAIPKDRADEARRLMERGIRAVSFEQVISQAIREGLADLSVVVAAPPASGDDVEDPAARTAVDNLLGDIFDEGDEL